MAAAEKISIALAPEMVSLVPQRRCHWRVRLQQRGHPHALRDWIHTRALRQQGISELRQLWQEALHDKMPPGIAVDDVLDRLERKY